MANRYYLLLLTIIISGTNLSYAGSEVNVDGKAPPGMESLETEIRSHDEAPENIGAHGYSAYCYKKDVYIVYSVNLLGHGYELSKAQPKDHKCVETNKNILAKNNLGLSIGMKKEAVESLIGIKRLKNFQSVIWLSDIYYNGIRFDLQTFAKFQFEGGRLIWLSVFTTETS